VAKPTVADLAKRLKAAEDRIAALQAEVALLRAAHFPVAPMPYRWVYPTDSLPVQPYQRPRDWEPYVPSTTTGDSLPNCGGSRFN